MNMEEAIRTAMEYERRIRDLYRESADLAEEERGRRLFTSLGDEEQGHLDYLEDRLRQWRDAGRITVEAIPSRVPDPEALQREVDRLKERASRDDRKSEIQMLSKALELEVETSDFYRRLTEEMSHEGRQMFARFLEIENDHVAIVQAQLDYLSQTGFWFDFKEFGLEHS
jgi:rubrerythrin